MTTSITGNNYYRFYAKLVIIITSLADSVKDLTVSFRLNYREILGSCRLRKLHFLVDIFKMHRDIFSAASEQYRYPFFVQA